MYDSVGVAKNSVNNYCTTTTTAAASKTIISDGNIVVNYTVYKS